MNLLAKLGLMRVSEHEAVKLKAAADEQLLQRMHLKGARNAVMARRIEDLEAEISSLRPDAEAMRRKRQMDRDRRANNRKGKA